MIGAALAASLPAALGSGSRVALIESRACEASIPGPEVVPSSRVVALSQRSVDLLERAGAWGGMKSRSASFSSMRVADSVGRGRISFEASECGVSELGFVVDNATVEAALYARVRALSDVDVYAPGHVTTVKLARDAPDCQVSLKDGRMLRASLVVGADGPGSLVRRAAHLQRASVEYDQHGVVATLALSGAAQPVAWQRFLPSGPVAVLPLYQPVAGTTYASLVWSMPPGEAQAALALPDGEFVERLNAALHDDVPVAGVLGAQLASLPHYLSNISSGVCARLELPRVESVVAGSRASWPLSVGHVTRYHAERAVLVGDAAHTVHPLAGQGANLGFADVASLCRVLGEAVLNGEDVGAPSVLGRYDAERRLENLALMTAMDALKRMFSNGHPILAALRSAGMSTLHLAPAAKRQLARVAMGV